MSTPSKQPNSKKNSIQQSENETKSSPPRRSRARDDSGEIAASVNDKIAVNLHRFSARLTEAATWRRGELPPHFPFGLCLWLVAVLGAAIIAQ